MTFSRRWRSVTFPCIHCGPERLMLHIKMAISSSAKRFVASPIVQSVVNDIYSGRVVYSSSAHRSIVADNYKPRAIEIYDSRNASWLNHYRSDPSHDILALRFNRDFHFKVTCAALWCNSRVLEFCLLVTYVHTMPFAYASHSPTFNLSTDSVADKDLDALHHFEVLFIIFAVAFALEEYTASIEHGWGSKCRHHNTFSYLH
jgi:hypothetical protein